MHNSIPIFFVLFTALAHNRLIGLRCDFNTVLITGFGNYGPYARNHKLGNYYHLSRTDLC